MKKKNVTEMTIERITKSFISIADGYGANHHQIKLLVFSRTFIVTVNILFAL